MKLAFCIFRYYPFGGLERNFLRILKEALSRGHTVFIYTMDWEGGKPDFIGDGDCKIINVPYSGLSNHSRCTAYVKNLAPLLAAEEFDLISGFNRMPGLDLYYCADVCFIADVRRRRSAFFKLTPRYRVYSSFENAVFSPEVKTHILALSHIQEKIYQQEYGTPPERFHQVPAGIDKAPIKECISAEKRRKFRQQLNIGDDEKMLLMIGSDFGRKGVSRSLKALAALPLEAKTKVKLFVLGKGNISKMKSLAAKLGISEQVILAGGVDNVPHYLSACDLLLHPAVSENTGNAIVEALIAGVPVLTTSNCGYAIHVERSGAGKVIEGIEFSQAEMNSKLSELLSLAENESDRLKEQALEYAEKTDFYSRPQAIVDIIEKLG